MFKYYQIQTHSGKFFCTEYEKSKAVADKVALDAASEGIPIVPVYPGVIYGPGKVTSGNVVARMVNISTIFLPFFKSENVFACMVNRFNVMDLVIATLALLLLLIKSFHMFYHFMHNEFFFPRLKHVQ